MEQRTRLQRRGGAKSLRCRIERWRRAGRPGKRMPEDLWQAAASLACEHGASRVAGELGLNYTALKQRAASVAGVQRRSSDRDEIEKTEFVEIDVEEMLTHGGRGATEIEVERGDGSRLRIRLTTGQRVDVEAMTAAFVRGSK